MPKLSNADIRSLIGALFRVQVDDQTWFYELGGGFSGAFVTLVAVPDKSMVVMKAGPAAQIEDEIIKRDRYARDNQSIKSSLEELKDQSLDRSSAEVTIELDGNDAKWKAMAYRYVGAYTYQQRDDFADFQDVFEDYVRPPRERQFVTETFLKSCLQTLVKQISQQNQPETQPSRPLYLDVPVLKWDSGITAVLETAAALVPEGEELRNLKDWWTENTARVLFSPWSDKRLVHGDMWFGNILVRKPQADFVALIDFGNVKEDHVLNDLARFECDLLFRISPPPSQRPRFSTEELRMMTLRRAFGGDFSCQRQDTKISNPQLNALQVLRQAYNREWAFGAKTERHELYRWFLLAEILKRLFWLDEHYARPEIRIALLKSVVMLKRAIDQQTTTRPMTRQEDPAVPSFASVLRLAHYLGCTSVYVPATDDYAYVNNARNAVKDAAIREAMEKSETVKLLAETGYSYLDPKANRFFNAVLNLVRDSGRFEVVLKIPNFTEAHGISKAYRKKPKSTDEYRSLGIHPEVDHKFQAAISGFQVLKDIADSNEGSIEMRFTRYGIPATTLITNDIIFFEPYLRTPREQRDLKLFDTFELQLEKIPEEARRMFEDNFDFYWRNSDSMDEWETRESSYEEMLKELHNMWSS